MKDKRYILSMFPYPSGEGLHVGHVEGYTGADVLARYWRRQGKEVLAPMGWDAFGLPAENFAIKQGIHPAVTTAKNIANFRHQMDSLSLSFDWDHELNTSDPRYYRWTQWIFTQLYKKELAYRDTALVNWCEHDQTVLANEQVVDGKCERCGNDVIQREMPSWYFKITAYADELLTDLDALDWPEKIKAAQRNWIGKSSGSLLTFAVEGTASKLEVYTTRADTLFGATYMVLSPEHPLVADITTAEQKVAVAKYQQAAAKKSELERTFLEKEKTGVFTGGYALHPLTKERLPIWIADYVVMSYGTGAIMAVPAHDDRDYTFAQKYELPIIQVVAPLFLSEGKDAPQPGVEPERRRVVMTLVKHWADDAYYGLEWTNQGWHSFVIGGIDEGETAEQAATREVKEETGYQKIKSARVVGPETHAHFFAHHKNVNRYAEYTYVVVELGGDEFKTPDPEEVKNHAGRWVPGAEVAEWLTLPNNQLLWDIYQHGERPVTGEGILINSGEYNGQSTAEARESITEKAGGELKTMYRLRDWLVSRQRYWGAPIPIIYCAKCGPVVVPDDQLPVELPAEIDFKPTGHSPLADCEAFVNTTCPTCGEPAKREVDTMDTFVCSSWYYLRYPNAQYAQGAFDPEALKQWLPVDEYIGGAEHAVLHLLYARFFTKALRDLGHLNFDEPFTSFRTPGTILGPDHQKMSKSRGNVINPDDIVAQFGPDALRLHLLFMGPFDAEKPWNTATIKGVVRFLSTVSHLAAKYGSTVVEDGPEDAETHAQLHRTICKVSEDLPAYRFNTAIAALMSLSHHFEHPWSASLKADFLTFVELLSPFAPTTAAKVWQELGQADDLDTRSWPVFDPGLLKEEVVEYVIQVNGKVRGQFTAAPGLSEAEAMAKARTDEKVSSYLGTTEPKRVIYVPGKLLNLVTD